MKFIKFLIKKLSLILPTTYHHLVYFSSLLQCIINLWKSKYCVLRCVCVYAVHKRVLYAKKKFILILVSYLTNLQVAGVVGRAEILSSAFFLCSFIFYVKATRRKKSTGKSEI